MGRAYVCKYFHESKRSLCEYYMHVMPNMPWPMHMQVSLK